ncbi:DUF4123 domain-containing protein [Tritonibacter scottomollicae]|nr:DUF4123 domain-containing protein [Tritonibacter scottomollicae]
MRFQIVMSSKKFIARDALVETVRAYSGLFLVLDATCLPGLPERLEAEGVPYSSLFQGQTAHELRDVAPYLVQVSPSDRLLRDFTDPTDNPRAIWPKRPGLLIACELELTALRKHLRRFLRVEIGDQAFFFRFWEAGSARAYFAALTEPNRRKRWFLPREAGQIDAFLIPDPDRDGLCVEAMNLSEPGRTEGYRATAPFNLNDQELVALRSHRTRQELAEMVSLMRSTFPDACTPEPERGLDYAVQRSVGRAWEFGIRQRKHAFRFAAWDLHVSGAFEAMDHAGALRKILEQPLGETEKMRRLEQRIAALEDI